MSTGIVLMSRAPIPGRTKTRLESHLEPAECAQLHKAFLKDISQMLLKVQEERDVNLYLAYTPAGSEDLFSGLIPEGFESFVQQGADLGEKMEHALEYAAGENEGQIIIGSDLPTLEPKTLINAIDLLTEKDIVLGPSKDGGYYLCGTNQPYSFLFNDIVWGQDEVLEATVDLIEEESDLDYALVDSCGDIDLYEELLELRDKLEDKSAWEYYPEATGEIVRELKVVIGD